MAFNRQQRRKAQKKMFKDTMKAVDEKAMDATFQQAFEKAKEETTNATTTLILLAASVVIYCDYNKIRNKEDRLVNFANLVKARVEQLALPVEEQPQEILEVSDLLDKAGVIHAREEKRSGSGASYLERAVS